ncbi:AraC family transcriptional regulator [Pseudoduganella namucuonensis]|uniref:AraC-type DNA-binding protein n=1 Tax=Pseudoduganella namucuonensis TaxID=1035707 RepID=A0A1I7INS3_9BURK|nr:AraC family transcriptional regulator [Pseudoduganella namucuonensis]SFU74605.1 AraC-type DNA-binding protein [Pseudoduganella namucuonensis]
MPPPNTHTIPRFWRDASLPFIEARAIDDGRKVGYANHSHETFSIGVIRSGRTDYINQASRQRVGPNTVVMMNPGDVHACNPIADEPWSYRMLYVDRSWLGGLQHEWGFSANQDFRCFAATMSTAPALYAGFNRFYEVLMDGAADQLLRQCAAVAFFEQVQSSLDPAALVEREANRKLERAAEFISDNCTGALKLEDICAAADLSPSYLIRAFKTRYGMTPHAYLLNRRIQLARGLLKGGAAIADVALDTGFSDQAHFQRIFKQFLAATPGQYRR